ncbi:hypothetical protein ES705_43834 [subsurface metagenome]
MNEVSLDVRKGPITELRGAAMAINYEFLSHAETLTLRGNPALIERGWWVFPIQLLTVHLLVQ